MNKDGLLILGIGIEPNKTDGVLRFEYFCQRAGLNYQIVGEGKNWKGGQMEKGMGGGQKINEIKEVIKLMENTLVIICDTFDLFPLATEEEILSKYHKICVSADTILFSAEVYCWPDKSLDKAYPKIDNKYKYLNSGCLMGYSQNIYQLIENSEIRDDDDDQLFLTQKFLTLSQTKIKLDHNCELFQTLNGSKGDVVLHRNRIYNKYTKTFPVFIHGNGPSKSLLNHFENYLGQINVYVEPKPIEPKVFFAFYIDSNNIDKTKLFLDRIKDINHQNKIVYIYDKHHTDSLQLPGITYRSNIDTYVWDDFKNSDCEYYFLVEERCIITNKNILQELLPHCYGFHRIVSPLLKSINNKLFTNYWGELNSDGYYQRASDYLAIVQGNLRGKWNVPYVSGCILMDRSIMDWEIMKIKKYDDKDRDMCLCYNFRKLNLFMYMINLDDYGYLLQN